MMPPADDIDRIMAIMAAAFEPEFGEAWTRRQVEDALLLGNCHYALTDARGLPPPPGGEAVGFSLSRHSLDEEELLLFAVAPGHRRKGLGQRMLGDLAGAARERGARRLLLEMRRGNPAESLYRGFGFHPIGERPNYYRMASGDRIDAITFALAIE
jgi:ribosomal-protein-alanine N-acetyltransferase